MILILNLEILLVKTTMISICLVEMAFLSLEIFVSVKLLFFE